MKLGLFQLVVGIGIPVPLGMRQSMAIGWNFQFQYAEATNASQLHTYPPIIGKSVQKRDLHVNDRALAYQGIEALLNRLVFGFIKKNMFWLFGEKITARADQATLDHE